MTSVESIITTNVMSNATISATPRSSCTFMRSISLLLDRRVVAHAHRVPVRGVPARERLRELERRSRVIVVILVHPQGHVERPPALQGGGAGPGGRVDPGVLGSRAPGPPPATRSPRWHRLRASGA